MGDERQAGGHTSRQGASSSQERVLLIRTARRLVVRIIRMCAELSYPSVVQRAAKMGARQVSQDSLHQEVSLLLEHVLLTPTAHQLVASRTKTCAEPYSLSTVGKLARMDELLVSQAPPHQERSSSLVHVLLIRIARPHAANSIKTSAGRFFP